MKGSMALMCVVSPILIAGAITTVECRVQAQLPGGDHSIFVGEVLHCNTVEGQPLVYFRSGYREIRN